MNTSGILAQAFATDALTSVRKAINIFDGQGYVPGVIVLHGGDCEAIELLTATTSSTGVRGVPVDPVARRLSGYPVVINNTLGAKVGLVIGAGAVIVDLDGRLETKWTDAVNDDIPKNQVRCRVETRAGVSVAQPGAVVCACRRRRDGFRAGGVRLLGRPADRVGCGARRAQAFRGAHECAPAAPTRPFWFPKLIEPVSEKKCRRHDG